jgi:hypothetical protein
MIEPVPSNGPATRTTARACLPPMMALAAAVALAAVGAGLSRPERPPVAGPQAALPAPQAETAAETFAETFAEAGPAAGSVAPATPADPWQAALGGPLSRWAWTAEPPAVALEDSAPPEPQGADASRAPTMVPLPVPRPPELRRQAEAPRRQRLARRQPAAPPPAPVEDDRSFLEKLFGVENPPARSYTALESRPADTVLAPRARLSPPLAPPSGDGGTAVYNIATRTVTLPSGERLEAHSGLGEMMDDPRYVNVRMRGATPPGTYALTERESLFHGVRAIRLTPVGGPEAIYGRVGLLAHTYMLGPSGASNGCVSFRNYDRFLQAYLAGEIRSLVVVPGTQDALPSLAQGGGATVRMARN